MSREDDERSHRGRVRPRFPRPLDQTAERGAYKKDRQPADGPRSTQGISLGSDYTPEEEAFLKALIKYKQEKHCPHPSWREVLDILKGLGWRPMPLPVQGPDPWDESVRI